MKFQRVVPALGFAVFCFVGPSVSAQILVPDNRYQGYPQSLIEWPKNLPDMKACRDQEVYEPLDTHLTKYVGRVKVAGSRIQEFDECTWSLTRNKWRWVVRPAGTKVLMDEQGRDLFDGGSPLGKVCTNPRSVSFIIAPEKQVMSPVEPHRYVVPEAVPERPRTLYAPIVVPVVPVPTPSPTPSPTPVDGDDPSSPWGITAGAMIGSFDSIPIGGTIESLTGRVVCLKGRGLDIGVARGGQESSMWRLTIASTAITEGSFTRYTCDNCTQTVTTTTESGVRILGARLERVQGFNNEEWRGIRPMISAHVGAGRISGRAYQHIVRSGITTAMHAAVDARELLNSSWVPMAGAGVGFMGDIGKHLTYSVVVAGIEYPGVYYGRVSLTYWP